MLDIHSYSGFTIFLSSYLDKQTTNHRLPIDKILYHTVVSEMSGLT